MSSQVFEAQLIGPDNAASQQQLAELITAGTFTGSGLPQVAHGYLDAFCNVSNSNGHRRWTGIALAAMMRASTGVVQRLKKLTQGLSRVGAIVLDLKESEERRIVAGLIIRQGLELGINFADFWMSDKVLHSAPNFPRDPGDGWMGHFQTYLDTLSSLALANLDNEPLVLFPMALSASDGFQWTGKSAVALLEKDVLTIVASDASLSRFIFIDLPVHRIKETGLQQDSPHESQEGRSGHKMHEVVITLRSDSRTYCLNSSDRTADEFKVSFLRHEDAHELNIGLQDARQTSARSAVSTTEADVVAKSSSPPSCTHQASVQHVDATLPPSNERPASAGSDTRSGIILDEPVSPEQVAGERTLAHPARHERSNGKLPKISLSTKQKVARTRQLPSGSAKVTKHKTSKNAAPIVEESGDEDEDVSSQDEYVLQSTMATSKSAATSAGKRSQGRRKAYADEDDDFDPKTSKGKSSTKRKRAFSEMDGDSQLTKKKTQSKLGNSSRSGAVNTTTKKPKMKIQQGVPPASASTRVPMKQSRAQQNIQHRGTSQPTLIGALKKSNSPTKANAPTFKRPGHPASTPGRPRTQPVRTTPKPQTPAGNLPVHGRSSTPQSRSIHDEDHGLGNTPVDTEILSSNTKRVPDSPHAESTAISGHAYRDDVHREKCIGDLETAKSDPFKQRQPGVQKMNSFTRKLTGESVADDKGESLQGEPLSMPAEMANDDLEIDDFELLFASQPLPKHSPSLFKGRTNTIRQSVQGSNVDVRAVNSLPIKKTRRVSTLDRTTGFQPTVRTTEKTRRESQRPQANESIVSAPREAIEDTLPDATIEPANCADFDGETTLVNEDMELPQRKGTSASDIRFRSSPPISDSSSVRGELYDESEQEPDPSPPTSRTDELEWEAALEPHQRALHEQLLRASKRLVRHIVDNETAVTDITDVFAADGERLLDLVVERQGNESAVAFGELSSKRQDLLNELSNASKNLKSLRKQTRAVE
ncbi:uncharacterized protein M421DRAFT_424830 [Didymella exigua CBS 183.55]|uniref:Uncharacterized protein n=1 Tax=Didymella exigua CBS 183.55 TaxID=1150837 RepID=A0A6A5RFA2_9PLEO|nr:uncharacterized protein M421DRAFT_424830 [Didymella exigua CBS 183.55]KAF1924377.1 hypothetical protein M421DRAFT_424830 [Didymella exigua CBS 183.55]